MRVDSQVVKTNFENAKNTYFKKQHIMYRKIKMFQQKSTMKCSQSSHKKYNTTAHEPFLFECIICEYIMRESKQFFLP